MRGAILLVVCGCNPVFGIDSTGLIDAPPDSPPIDAPAQFTCPPPGTTPTFGTQLTMVPARDCTGYSLSDSGASLATCGVYPTASFSTGENDGPLTAMTIQPAPGYGMIEARLTPEGDRAIVLYWDYDGNVWSRVTDQYVRAEDGVWKAVGEPYTPHPYHTNMSTPSRGVARRVVLQTYDSSYQPQFTELEASGNTWVVAREYPLADLGVTNMTEPSLSADGLRLVFVDRNYVPQTTGGDDGTTTNTTTATVFYADRQDLGSPFGLAQILQTVPDQVDWPYMTENCGRIYFSALNTVWYLEQPR